jgi:hypothetical protein
MCVLGISDCLDVLCKSIVYVLYIHTYIQYLTTYLLLLGTYILR